VNGDTLWLSFTLSDQVVWVGGIRVQGESGGSLDGSEGGAGGKTGVDSDTLWLSFTLSDEVVGVGGIWVEGESSGSLDGSEGGAGGKTGVNGNTLWLSFTLVDLAVGRDMERCSNGLVAGGRWVGINVGGGVSENLSISITLANQVGSIAISTIVVGGIAIAISAKTVSTVDTGITITISSIENRGIGFGLTSDEGGKGKKCDLHKQVKCI